MWHLLDINWNNTKAQPCHLIWPSRDIHSGGQSNSHKWLASWKIGSVEEFETLKLWILHHHRSPGALDDLPRTNIKIWNYFGKGNHTHAGKPHHSLKHKNDKLQWLKRKEKGARELIRLDRSHRPGRSRRPWTSARIMVSPRHCAATSVLHNSYFNCCAGQSQGQCPLHRC